MPEEYVGRKFETEFIDGDDPNTSIIEKIIETGKTLNKYGLTPLNAGNISVRTKKGMLITAGGVNKGRLTRRHVVEVVGFKGKTASVIGSEEPSSEVPMHWLIYQKFPNVNTVIHAHDSSVVENPLGLVVTDHIHPYGTLSQAKDVVNALDKCNYIVIKKHGVLAVGKTLSEAIALIEDMYSR